MSKDEMKKELIDFWHKTFNIFVLNDSQAEKICKGLLEPREKRIAELEQKLEQTEKDLADYQFNYPTIKELEKENAELKEINTHTLSQLNLDNGELITKLTKAKEIIKTCLGFMQAFGYSPSIDKLVTEAEQFLKE